MIIRFDEDNLWRQRDLNRGSMGQWNSRGFGFNIQNSALDAFGDSRIAKSESLSDQRQAAIGLLRGYLENTLDAASVFDVELLGKFFAVTELWIAKHGISISNLAYCCRMPTINITRASLAAIDSVRLRKQIEVSAKGLHE